MALLEGQNLFTVPAITSLYSSPFALGFSVSQRQVAIRALLRFNAHVDGMHYLTKSPDGLHLAYVAFNPANKPESKAISWSDLVEASLDDVFDAITMQDCLDGRLSVLIRCPGTEIPSSIEQLTVNVYITPCEVVCGDTAMLIQAFCQEFAMPHLQCFVEQCEVDLTRPHHLPAIVCQHSSQIQCMVLSTKVNPDTGEDDRHLSPSAAICESVKLIPGTSKAQTPGTLTTSLHQHSAHQCCPVDTFLYTANTNLSEPIPLVISPDQSAFGSLLVSIGPSTDAVLDHFGLEDDLLPRLHILVGTVHSSCWEAILRAVPWNLTYEQASNLSRALLADIKGTPAFHIIMVFLLCECSSPLMSNQHFRKPGSHSLAFSSGSLLP
ncbi:hypothetical protein PISMIDRAFT_108977 [Pisolithus microcarpus 441]|uniref:Unplaced genomic scaffold scaffold_115, whole genome shotgun sequence n=1 Tax=Pisolithus microcarpus 441 TaxID=765257 RepID=A0A0C9YPZ8_9AGAM|nr:hypothetical protein PISMIDRAFT_109008 [Pisolithus microcarpus 441]KIK18697.1 hypothetical protein PISMIDRAFT_108977 [Pisolithus microcarpus 441]